MKVAIKQIAKIRTGVTFRNGLKEFQKGNIAVIQLRDIDKDIINDFSNLEFKEITDIKESHYLNRGDIIFRTRENLSNDKNCYAAIFESDFPAVVSAPLLIIKVVQRQNVLPEYLHWYLNQDIVKKYFLSEAKGSLQKTISLKTIEEMEINIPNMTMQKQIVELDSLLKKETEIMESIIIKRKNVITQKLLNLIKGD